MPQAHLTIVPVPGDGAEDVLLAPDGSAYTGTGNGLVWHVEEDGARITRVGDTGGRPLGLEWLPDGRLLVCDADKGLLALDGATGHVEVLATSAGGQDLVFTNNAAVAADGTVWFTDSSNRFGVREWKNDLLADSQSGRLIRRDTSGAVDVVLDGLSFANGVAIVPDESFVVVAETARCRLQKVWVTGQRAGRSQIFVEDLPAHPDNIARGSDGLIWVTYASPRDPTLALLQRGPALARSAALHLPEALRPAPRRTARVVAYDTDGRLVRDLAFDATDWHMATGVRELNGRLWLGSLAEPALASFALG